MAIPQSPEIAHAKEVKLVNPTAGAMLLNLDIVTQEDSVDNVMCFA